MNTSIAIFKDGEANKVSVQRSAIHILPVPCLIRASSFSAAPGFLTFLCLCPILCYLLPCSALSQAWGWVQEMYGFTLALWIGGVKHVDLYMHMAAQPPWDTNLVMAPGKPFHIIHYTYGMDYKLTGEGVPFRLL